MEDLKDEGVCGSDAVPVAGVEEGPSTSGSTKDEGGECELDAVPLAKVVKKKVKRILSGRSPSSPTLGRSKIRKEAREYDMNHRRRGRAVVFNQINFSSACFSKRNGAETDGKNLTQTLSALGFTVKVHVDRESSEIEAILKEVQEENHSDADCVLVAMLTHGDEEGFLYDSRGWKFLPSKLWTPFTADLCPSLAGKPKIFLVQACQGNVLDGVVAMSLSKKFSSYQLPNHADFLIATSTISGKASLRNTMTGSKQWYSPFRHRAFTIVGKGVFPGILIFFGQVKIWPGKNPLE